MITRIIFFAVFLSGFASLGYELCWIRKGSLLIGATPQALSIVVAVFFGGMAAGACLFGLFSKRTANALLWYGILECAIGLMAAATPWLFGLAGDAYAQAYQWFGNSQTLHVIVRSGAVAALIFPSCVLMGGTLPLLCQFSINNRQADIRFAAGNLYAVNTAGAFLGCMFCGIWFIPFWGIDAAIRFNCLLSLAAGVGSILLSRVVSTAPADASLPIPVPGRFEGALIETASTRFSMYALFFLAGFAALGYEILWVRFLSLIIHNTVYTCIFTLGAILLGIAVGGLMVSLTKDRPRLDVPLFAVTNFFIALSVLLLLLQPVSAWDWIRETNSVTMQALLCLIIILVPSVASGISFPLAYRLVATNAENSGRDFGRLTAVNTIGGIAGSLLVGFYLLPTIGMYATLMYLTVISMAIGTGTLFFFADGITLIRRGMIAVGAVTVWLGAALFSGSRLPADFLAGKQQLIEFAEGISSFIAVVDRGSGTTLEIDRMWQGINKKGHQILAAHIPMILHPDPKSVLVIGMGTGQTASRFLMYDIEHLDCVDIEKTLPGILKRHFDAAWLSDPRTHVVTDDGRNFTAYATRTYDVVSIEVGQSFRPQIAGFYTVDFYLDVKKRLAENGLACQFVPIGFFTEQEFRSVVRSFLEVFPQSTLWFNKHAECLLIGNALQQPQLTTTRLGLLRGSGRVRADLAYSFDDKPWLLMNRKEVFAANFLMGPQKLSELSAAVPSYRDNLPILEYQTARTVYSLPRMHAFMERNLESPAAIFAQGVRVASEAKIVQIREETLHETLKER